MSDSRQRAEPKGESARDQATAWLVKRDRGLTAGERAQLAKWLAADPRHAAAFAQAEASWRLFRSLAAEVRTAPETVAASAGRVHWLKPLAVALAAAAAVALVLLPRNSPRRQAESLTSEPVLVVRATDEAKGDHRLEDGSALRLKGGAAIEHAFTRAERRVRVVRGEVFFAVAKDPARPFVVEVGGATVRAVGTAFSIRLEPQDVAVLVTEGTVQVTPKLSDMRLAARAATMVTAGNRAVLSAPNATQEGGVEILAVTPEDVALSLAWQESMVELEGATLGELAVEFAQRTGRKIEIKDPALRGVRIGGRLPMNDPEMFIRALEKIYDVKAEHRANGVIELSRVGAP